MNQEGCEEDVVLSHSSQFLVQPLVVLQDNLISGMLAHFITENRRSVRDATEHASIEKEKTEFVSFSFGVYVVGARVVKRRHLPAVIQL